MLGANDAAHSGVQGVSNDAMRRLSTYEGGLAQLGEHLLCKQGVVGSIPSSSTIYHKTKAAWGQAVLVLVDIDRLTSVARRTAVL